MRVVRMPVHSCSSPCAPSLHAGQGQCGQEEEAAQVHRQYEPSQVSCLHYELQWNLS